MRVQTAVACILALPTSLASVVKRSGTASVTPHEQYSSSVGVLGCKINTNRVAYWPGSVSCDDICVRIVHGANSLHVLKIDTSAGAYDISYDAWNYLLTGKSAKESPQTGGGIEMSYEFVHAGECAHLLDNGRLPVSAITGMNYAASCMSELGSWVGDNLKLININDPQCKEGMDVECTVDFNISNLPSCPPAPSSSLAPVINIQYGTGIEIEAV